MEHQCEECKQKLDITVGIRPTTCDCVESYCGHCWLRLFDGRFVESSEPYYKKNMRGEYVRETQRLLVSAMETDVRPRCPLCGEEYFIDKIRDWLPEPNSRVRLVGPSQ